MEQSNSSSKKRQFDLGIAQILLQKTSDELSRSWTRNNILLTINAGLMAFAASLIDKVSPALFVGFAILGLTSTAVWFQLIRVNKYYSNRWIRDTYDYLNQFPEEAGIFRTSTFTSPERKPNGPRASDCIKVLAIALSLIWISLLLYGVSLLSIGDVREALVV